MPRVPVSSAVRHGLVTSPASDQCFAFPRRHQPEPGWNLLPFVTIEVSHLAKVVDLNTNRAAAQLACISLESFEQLRAFRVRGGWSLIDDGVFPASDRKAPALSYQGFLPGLTLDGCLKARERTIRCGDACAVFRRHLGHCALVLVGKGLEHRGLHRPFQSVRLAATAMDVVVVELAALTNAALVPNPVAAAQGIPEQAGRPLADVLPDATRLRQLLLVLDNCEHLIVRLR